MGRPKKGGTLRIPPKDKPTLGDNAIGKGLARQARAAWAVSEEVFEEHLLNGAGSSRERGGRR